jgi:N-acetylglucosamine kinase-like BadF-type ATPase
MPKPSARTPVRLALRPSTLVIGVDAGGSHTSAAVANETKELARHTGPASAVAPKAVAESAEVIAGVVKKVMALARQRGPALTLVVGAAGVGREAERKALETALKRSKLATTVRVIPDGAIALCAAFGRGAGILVHAGSGSIAYAQSATGQVWRTGGLGWQLGDEGSGYALGRAALGAAGRAWDGRGPQTALGDALLATLKLAKPDDLVRWAQSAGRAEVVRLAEATGGVARRGDAVALALVDQCAADLADHVSTLLTHFSSADPVTVALGGGMLTPDSPVRERLVARLRHDQPKVSVSPDAVDPVKGALVLARELAT